MWQEQLISIVKENSLDPDHMADLLVTYEVETGDPSLRGCGVEVLMFMGALRPGYGYGFRSRSKSRSGYGLGSRSGSRSRSKSGSVSGSWYRSSSWSKFRSWSRSLWI